MLHKSLTTFSIGRKLEEFNSASNKISKKLCATFIKKLIRPTQFVLYYLKSCSNIISLGIAYLILAIMFEFIL